MLKFLRDTQLMFGRSLIRTLRNPVWVVIGLLQPVLYLLLFAPLLDGLRMPGFDQTSSLNIFVPGLLVMIALFSAGFAGFGILDDLREGVVERLRVTPASRLALLLGMVLHDVLVFLIQCGLLVVAATLMGLRADPVGLALLFGLDGAAGVDDGVGFLCPDPHHQGSKLAGRHAQYHHPAAAAAFGGAAAADVSTQVAANTGSVQPFHPRGRRRPRLGKWPAWETQSILIGFGTVAVLAVTGDTLGYPHLPPGNGVENHPV